MAIDTSKILINGASYDWASLTISFNLPELADAQIYGFSKIEYENDMPIVNNFGRGIYPVSWGRQNVSAKASLTLSAEEFHKLEDASETGYVQDLPKFDVIVEYTTAEGNYRKDIIKNCHITKDGRSLSQNDPESKVDIELNPTHIEFNAQ